MNKKSPLKGCQKDNPIPQRNHQQLPYLQEVASFYPQAFVDANWGADPHTRRSVTGWTILLNHSLVSWQSVSQKTVALSTMDAEYAALASVVQEIVFLRGLLQEIGLEMSLLNESSSKRFSEEVSDILV